MATALGIMLFKIGSPAVQGNCCLRVKSKLEVSTHVIVLITSLAYAALVEFFYGHSTHICVDRECITYKRLFYSSHIVSYVITSFVVFILVFCVILLVHLY